MISDIRITKVEPQLCDPNITNHCNISYNPELGVVSFYSNMTF